MQQQLENLEDQLPYATAQSLATESDDIHTNSVAMRGQTDGMLSASLAAASAAALLELPQSAGVSVRLHARPDAVRWDPRATERLAIADRSSNVTVLDFGQVRVARTKGEKSGLLVCY